MILTLRREALNNGVTLGILEVAGKKFPTIELPPDSTDKHDSCVPFGEYRVVGHVRASGEKAFLLTNPTLGVWGMPSEANGVTDARSAVFLAAGYHINDLIGSHIAPGKNRIKKGGDWILEHSRDAMNEIRTLIGSKFDIQLVIE